MIILNGRNIFLTVFLEGCLYVNHCHGATSVVGFSVFDVIANVALATYWKKTFVTFLRTLKDFFLLNL